MRCSVTHGRGQDDVGVLNLKEVINLRVARQLLTGQPKRAELFLPALEALTAESFDRGHWREQTVNLCSFVVPQKDPKSTIKSKIKTLECSKAQCRITVGVSYCSSLTLLYFALSDIRYSISSFCLKFNT